MESKELIDTKENTISFIYIVYNMAPLLTLLGNSFSMLAYGFMILVMIWAIYKRELVWCLPATLYFYFGYFFITSIFHWFVILYIIYAFIRRKYNGSVLKNKLAPYMVCILYCLLVLSTNNLYTALLCMLEVTVVLFATAELKQSEYLFQGFWKMFVIAAISSAIVGLVGNNTIKASFSSGTGYYFFNRIIGTFDDPNYAGFYYNLAICVCVTMNVFKNRVLKYFAIALLYVMLIVSVSVTALFANVILILCVLLFKNRISLKSFLWIAALFSLLLILYYCALIHDDWGYLYDFAVRLEQKIELFSTNDLSGVTSGRTSIAQSNFRYYWNQDNIFNYLFGLNGITTRYIDTTKFAFASHNEYIDLLLNVGIIGLLFYMGNIFVNAFTKSNRNYLFTEHETFIKSARLLYIVYAFTITLFLEPRFMVFHFIF